MKKMLVAVAIALVPLTVSPAFAQSRLSSNHAAAASDDARPKICFVFGPWKYCI